MDSTADTEARLKALMLAALDGDARAYRSLLDDLRQHLRRYYARRLDAALAANCAISCRIRSWPSTPGA